MKLIKFKNYKLLTISILNILCFLFLYHNHRIYLSKDNPECRIESCNKSTVDEVFSKFRNTQSSPTEFLLPSSTVVAKIQENNKKYVINIKDINCLIKLDEKGFKVLDLKSPYKANSIAAIFEFQLNAKIKADGKLNKITRTILNC
tara:strand:- start:341 stop:778 length:438 start_codon:yes stop_codon:yes gene_type:complete